MRTIIRAEAMGACFGVTRALSMARDALASGGRVRALGPLIHNRVETAELSVLGLESVTDEEALQGDGAAPLIISAHGVAPLRRKRLVDAGVALIDATCPVVLKNQSEIARYAERGARVIIAGDVEHSEVKALIGFAPDAVAVVDQAGAEALIGGADETALVAQTTISPQIFHAITRILSDKFPALVVVSSLCPSVGKRQDAVANLAGRCDAIVVVGDIKSANARALQARALAEGVPAFLVDTPSSIPALAASLRVIGLTAAASVTEKQIAAVEEALALRP